MTVLHAIALARGLESTAADVSQFLETMRENERLQKSVVRLRKLLVRSTVLKTERARWGGSVRNLHPTARLASHSEAEGLIAEVVSLRKLSAEGRQARLAPSMPRSRRRNRSCTPFAPASSTSNPISPTNQRG